MVDRAVFILAYLYVESGKGTQTTQALESYQAYFPEEHLSLFFLIYYLEPVHLEAAALHWPQPSLRRLP